MRLIDADRLLSDQMKSKYYHLPNGDTAIPIIDIEHSPTVGGWISVNDRMPAKDQDVIIYGYYVGPSGEIYPTTIISDIEEFKHYECVPIAWMPLPEPPKEA